MDLLKIPVFCRCSVKQKICDEVARSRKAAYTLRRSELIGFVRSQSVLI